MVRKLEIKANLIDPDTGELIGMPTDPIPDGRDNESYKMAQSILNPLLDDKTSGLAATFSGNEGQPIRVKSKKVNM